MGLSGCASYWSQGRQDGGRKVVVYTPFPNAAAQALAEAFQARTGIAVEQNLDSTTKILARLRIEKRWPRCDVWYSGGGMVPFMTAAQEDLLEPYVPPEWRHLPYKRGALVMRDRAWRWSPLAIVSLGFCYNPQVLQGEAIPRRWEDLTRPRFRGQIEMWDPSDSGTSMLFLEASLQRYLATPGGEEAGWRYLKAIYANLKRYTVEGKPAFAVARGECQIGLQFESQYLEFLEQQFLNRQLGQGARHLAWYLPEQSPVLVDGIALIKGAPHPQEGRQFIDFCLSLEGQKIINRYFFSINPQLPPPPGLEGIDLETLLERAQPLDPQWMADNYDRVRQRWQNEVEASIEV